MRVELLGWYFFPLKWKLYFRRQWEAPFGMFGEWSVVYLFVGPIYLRIKVYG